MCIQKLLYQNIVWRSLFIISGFILNILIARHFQASFTGRFYYLITWYAFITLIFSVSMESGILYFISKKEIKESALLNLALLWVILSAAVMMSLFIFFTVILQYKLNFIGFLFAMLFICGNLLISFVANIWYAKKNFIIPNITGIIINFALITLMFFIPYCPWLNDSKFIYFYFSSFFIQGIFLVGLLTSQGKQKISFLLPQISQIKNVFHYSIAAFLGNIVSFFLYRIDYWFVHKYCSAPQLGEYVQVSKLAQTFFLLPSMLATVLFQLTAGGHRKQVNDTLMLLSRSLFLVYSLICLLLGITGSWLFPLIFGKSFSGMYTPFLFLIPGILAFSSLYVLTAYYAGKNRLSVNVRGCIYAFIFVLAGDIFFIPKYGINAAAAISSLGYIIYFIYVLNVFIKEYHYPLADFFYFKFSDFKKYKISLKKIYT